MAKFLKRREFVKQSAAIGIGSVIGTAIMPSLGSCQKDIDIAVVGGTDYAEGTHRAIELLGGMQNYVPKNSKVAILANAQGHNPGTYTKPQILRATIQMCKAAGASAVSCLSWESPRNWKKTGLKKVIDDEEVNLKISDAGDESLFRQVNVSRGKNIKQVRIMESFFQHDIFINMPITKEHSGNNFSGTMKNMMGINSPESDQTFHRRNWTQVMDDLEYLDECIADLNSIFPPHLCIVDATVFVTTNGPFGPGELATPQKVIAGTDRVAVDAYCCSLMGLNPAEMVVLNRAYQLGIGEPDLRKVKIKEIEI